MTLAVAIVGAGGIAGQHAVAMESLRDDWRITHVCDLNSELSGALAARTGAEATTELECVLTTSGVDVVDICLPPSLHVPTALKALDAGKHVVCEKPIAGSLAEIDALRAAALAVGRHVFPVFQYRHGPALRRLDLLKQAGLLGAPRVASLDTHWDRNSSYYSIAWRGTWAHELGGAVLSHAIHIHDLIRCAFGPVAEVSAFVGTLVNPIETEDCAAIILRMANGALATSSITLGSAENESRLRLVYERATVESGRFPYNPAEADWTVTARSQADQAAIDAVIAPEGLDGFAGYFSEVANMLEGRSSKAADFDDGAASIELATAIYQSARRGTHVSLPLATDAPFYNGWGPQ